MAPNNRKLMSRKSISYDNLALAEELDKLESVDKEKRKLRRSATADKLQRKSCKLHRLGSKEFQTAKSAVGKMQFTRKALNRNESWISAAPFGRHFEPCLSSKPFQV